MSNTIIDYLLALRDGQGQRRNIYDRCFQIAIPNFPPESTIVYNIQPTGTWFAYIMYQFSFGESMIPHSFDVVIRQGGHRVLDATISGGFTTRPYFTFVIVEASNPLNVEATNTRVLVNYYEATTFYLAIQYEADFRAVIEALKRYSTALPLEGGVLKIPPQPVPVAI